MRIDELFGGTGDRDQSNDFKPNFDVVDDICVYMRNDPIFYRKNYYPMVDAMEACFNEGEKVDTKDLLFPVVDAAIRKYVEQYQLAKTTEEIFTPEDRMAIAKKIYSEEMSEIRKGTYKK